MKTQPGEIPRRAFKAQKRINMDISTAYKHGFVTPIESHSFPKGLNEKVIEGISQKKEEPDWALQLRLKAFRHWKTLKEPQWARLKYPPIDYQDISYFSAPKKKPALNSLSEADPELLKTFEKLGIPLSEQKRLSGVAIDAVFDSVSVATTHQELLKKHGVIFCSMSEAVKKHPDLVQKHLCSVVPLSGQLLCLPEHSCFYRRLFLLYSERSPLPCGSFHLFSHQ